MIHKKLKILFDKKQNTKIIFLLFASLLATFFELIGIGSIPAFAIVIIDLNKFLSILSTYISIDFLSQISKESMIIIVATCLVLIFVVKNLYLFLIIYFQGKVLKNLRFATSL